MNEISSQLANSGFQSEDDASVFKKFFLRLEEKASDFPHQIKRKYRSLGVAARRISIVIFFLIPLVVIVIGARYIQNSQDLRSAASVKDGPAVIVLSPTSTTVGNRQKENTQIFVTTSGRDVIGFQLVARVTGKIPRDLEILPESIPGLNLVMARIDDVAAGKEIILVYFIPLDSATTNPETGEVILPTFSTDNPIKFGTIGFTGEKKGSMTIEFDPDQTIILESDSNEDLADIPLPVKYTYGSSSSDPSPSPSASPTVSPSSSPSPDGGGKPGQGRGRNK